ncbi:hypothetical protein ACFQZ4_45535 [Catellatospora coxensis]
MLIVSLCGALAAAVCFGLSSVMQAVGMRKAGPVSELEPKSLVRAWLTLPFLAGVGLDLLGFGFELVALRHLPLFLVQAAIASALAVTAIAAAVVMKERLGRAEKCAVGAVCVGLALLGVSAGPEGRTARTPTSTPRWPHAWWGSPCSARARDGCAGGGAPRSSGCARACASGCWRWPRARCRSWTRRGWCASRRRTSSRRPA